MAKAAQEVASESAHAEINQRSPDGKGPAHLLGVCRSSAGKKSCLEITDAVIFQPATPAVK